MWIDVIALAWLALAQQPAATPEVEVTTLSARLGPCAADFSVTDAEGRPVYAAAVHVRVRYGFLGVKRSDLEVGTNSSGKARIEGLPAKAKPLVYDIQKNGKKAEVTQDVTAACNAKYEVSLK